MDKIFEHLSSSWIRYFDYEWRTAKDGHEYPDTHRRSRCQAL